MLAQGNAQPIYRSVIKRSVVCTMGIVITYLITTAVFILALHNESPENEKVRGV